MAHNSDKTEENSLEITIDQTSFDAILNGTKDKEYRQINGITVSKYIDNKQMDGELEFVCNSDLISQERFDKYRNDIMYYNNGVFPYIPKDIRYLNLGVGYHEDRDTMTVEVVDISFEPNKDEEGNVIRVSYEEAGEPIRDEEGDFTIWNIVFHLGEIVERDLKLNR